MSTKDIDSRTATPSVLTKHSGIPYTPFTATLNRVEIGFVLPRKIRIGETEMEFCDLSCKFADWPEEDALDGSGSCRTFQAIYCKKHNRHVHRNMPCRDKSKNPVKGSPSDE